MGRWGSRVVGSSSGWGSRGGGVNRVVGSRGGGGLGVGRVKG